MGGKHMILRGMQKNNIPLHEKALLENQRAEEAHVNERDMMATLEYIAMMCDVDIDEEPEEAEV